MRINTIHVERVPWIPFGVDVVVDCPDGELPVLWVREDVPEVVVEQHVAAALRRLAAAASGRQQ